MCVHQSPIFLWEVLSLLLLLITNNNQSVCVKVNRVVKVMKHLSVWHHTVAAFPVKGVVSPSVWLFPPTLPTHPKLDQVLKHQLLYIFADMTCWGFSHHFMSAKKKKKRDIERDGRLHSISNYTTTGLLWLSVVCTGSSKTTGWRFESLWGASWGPKLKSAKCGIPPCLVRRPAVNPGLSVRGSGSRNCATLKRSVGYKCERRNLMTQQRPDCSVIIRLFSRNEV